MGGGDEGESKQMKIFNHGRKKTAADGKKRRENARDRGTPLPIHLHLGSEQAPYFVVR